ncbi:MAG: glycerophosphodiester phosphodiesterase family protein, partial [Pseudomonadota bacterium]|nr:glycerophosphodiester phosphodiesterase family protein [Pseudomonadota bacterium]
MNRPLNIAHRGGANLWPENTLEAFDNAINTGVDGIECDIQHTRDDRLVIHHDDRLKPEATRESGNWLTAPTPRIRELDRSELDVLDVGRLQPDSAYSQTRAGQTPIDGARIPDFDAVKRLIATRTGPEFRIYCELKTHLLDDTAAHARHLADLFCTTLAASPVRARTLVVSFDWRCLEHVRAAFPDLPVAHSTPPLFITDPDRDPETPLSGVRGQLRAASAAGAKWLGKHDWRNQLGQTHGEKMLAAISA